MPTGCSTPSSPPSPAVWAWDSRSAVRSWKFTRDDCQLPGMRGPVRRFISSCPCIRMMHHDRAPQIVARSRKRQRVDRLCYRRRLIDPRGAYQSLSTRRLVGWWVCQAELARANIHVPIIFMTGHGDIPVTVRAMKGGAVDFLTKPFRDQDMLDAVVTAIERDRKRREAEKIVAELKALFETLTSRERQVLALVASGLMNKQIAAEVGLAEITLKIHLGHIMKKMGARSMADLVRKAETLGIHRIKP